MRFNLEDLKPGVWFEYYNSKKCKIIKINNIKRKDIISVGFIDLDGKIGFTTSTNIIQILKIEQYPELYL